MSAAQGRALDTQEAGEPLVKYFSRAKQLRVQLASVEDTIKEDILVMCFLNGLPQEFRH